MEARQSKQHSDSWGQSDTSHLPEDVLLKILTFVPAPDLIHRCRLVCTLWRDIVDSPTLWTVKCQRMGYITKSCRKLPADRKHFYYLSSLKRNLLKNPRALEGFQSWVIESDGGDKWAVEDLADESETRLAGEKVTKYFVTSFRTCLKSQLINLRRAGYGRHLMDHVQPDIVIRDWYAARTDCGCQYEVLVQLQSGKRRLIQEYKPEKVIIPEERLDADDTHLSELRSRSAIYLFSTWRKRHKVLGRLVRGSSDQYQRHGRAGGSLHLIPAPHTK
ncbi:F-box only protein 44-like isoform X1 [Pseudophryne corroboree]|uniref:F-box only protein 44-like isoform X1 n=1 Tax=Pseudophryne corroboree TaxID=495146 RepID=UPI0030816AB4